MSIIVTAKVKAFHDEPAREYSIRVDADGSMSVWDDVAEDYLDCHCLSAASQRKILLAIESGSIDFGRLIFNAQNK